MDIGLDALFQDSGVVSLLKKEWSVQAEIDQYVAVLLKSSFFELRTKDDDLHSLRTQDPGFIQVAFFSGYPKVPEYFQFVGVIFMQELASQQKSTFGISAVVKSFLEDDGLVP